jgi:hypothetical protein
MKYTTGGQQQQEWVQPMLDALFGPLSLFISLFRYTNYCFIVYIFVIHEVRNMEDRDDEKGPK